MDDQTDPKDTLPGNTHPNKRHPVRLPPSDHMSEHRARIRAKVMVKDAETLSELELLETILYAGRSRRDTKPLAKDLIRHFGSLSAVLRAPQAQLIAVDSFGEAAMSAIRIVEVAGLHVSHSNIRNSQILTSWSAVQHYCMTVLAH